MGADYTTYIERDEVVSRIVASLASLPAAELEKVLRITHDHPLERFHVQPASWEFERPTHGDD